MTHRKQPTCADVRSWLQVADSDGRYGVVARWSDHAAGCATCRGTLVLLVQEVLGHESVAYQQVSCGACQLDLAPYIDAVQEYNERIAAQRYPHVWWHLWTCPECAETYQLTTALVEAEAHGELLPMSMLLARAPARSRVDLRPRLSLVLSRQLLALAFGDQPQLGVVRGHDDERVLADDTIQNFSVCVAVSQVRQTTCCFSVTIRPPASGRVVVRLGEQAFRATFDAEGAAHILQFPLDLLRACEGPDLALTLEGTPGDPS